jgi:hypothetical protein
MDIVDIGEEIEQTVTEVKIAFPMSHNALTILEEYIQMKDNRLKVEIAQPELSDLRRENHAKA